jgi:Ras homolog enriched in brain
MIQIIYDKIINFCGIKEIPCVIVGSKVDLPQRCVFHSIRIPFRLPACLDLGKCSRQVQPSEGEDLAKAIRAVWVESSSKNNVNVGELPFYSYPKRYLASIDIHGSQSLRAVSR